MLEVGVMGLDLVHGTERGSVHCGDSLAQVLPVECDLLLVDPPYSARTHSGHSDSINGRMGEGKDSASRRQMDYLTWTRAQVFQAVESWHPATRGWIVVMSDHELQREWQEVLETVGRYVFAPLPFYSPGSRVRLAGDGPSSWTVWITVARPRHKPYSNWGTLPGGYVGSPERMPLVGGKPVKLMRALVSDYSRPGDLVADPCCGAGSTLEAADDLGRRWWGCDIDPKHAKMAANRMGAGLDSGPLFEGATDAE